VEPEGAHGQRIEERAVVGDHETGTSEPLECVEQPAAPLRIEMVRRLIEQQDVRRSGERGTYLPALALSWRERVPPIDLSRIEPEPSPQCGIGRFPRHSESANVLGQRLHLLGGRDDNGVPRVERELPTGRCEVAGDQSQQGRLAGAVAADHTGPALAEVRSGVGEHLGRGRIPEREIVEMDRRHGSSSRTRPAIAGNGRFKLLCARIPCVDASKCTGPHASPKGPP
jgi:hypothetical protein